MSWLSISIVKKTNFPILQKEKWKQVDGYFSLKILGTPSQEIPWALFKHLWMQIYWFSLLEHVADSCWFACRENHSRSRPSSSREALVSLFAVSKCSLPTSSSRILLQSLPKRNQPSEENIFRWVAIDSKMNPSISLEKLEDAHGNSKCLSSLPGNTQKQWGVFWTQETTKGNNLNLVHFSKFVLYCIKKLVSLWLF